MIKVPEYWEKYSEDYINGWSYAENEYQDLIDYDENFFADHLEEDARAEAYEAGYYDFWKSKNFGSE